VRLSALAPSFISLAFLFRFLRLCLMRGGGVGLGGKGGGCSAIRPGLMNADALHRHQKEARRAVLRRASAHDHNPPARRSARARACACVPRRSGFGRCNSK